MSQIARPIAPQPIQHDTGAAMFNIENEEARIAYMKALGAKNLDPPLARSTHLKIISNGRILPYDEILAEQNDLVQNCDQYGNTDPAAWGPQVDYTAVDPDAQRIAMARAQEAVLSQALHMTNTHRVAEAVDDPAAPLPTEYPKGVIAVADIQNLHSLLES